MIQRSAALLAAWLKAKEAASNRLSSTCATVFGCNAARKKSQLEVISGISLAAQLTGYCFKYLSFEKQTIFESSWSDFKLLSHLA